MVVSEIIGHTKDEKKKREEISKHWKKYEFKDK